MNRRAVAFFLATSVFFGGTFVAAKAGLSYFPPLLFVALRFDVAALALLTYVALTRSRADLLPRTRGDVAGILATGVLTVGLTNALLFVGQGYVTSGVASIIVSLNPVLTPVFAAMLVADERLSRRGAAGMALGLVGVGLVVSPDPANLLAGGVVGKLLLLGSATVGALGSVLIRRADSDLSSTVRTAWGLAPAAALCHLLRRSADIGPETEDSAGTGRRNRRDRNNQNVLPHTMKPDGAVKDTPDAPDRIDPTGRDGPE